MRSLRPIHLVLACACIAVLAGCGGAPPDSSSSTPATDGAERNVPVAQRSIDGSQDGGASSIDTHSFARPQEARVTHVALDLTADFASRTLKGTADLTIARAPGARAVVLDTSGRDVSGAVDPVLGQSLTVALPDGVSEVVVTYATRPEAAALQWLEPRQTAGARQPFLYSQGEPILTRTWIPTQDSPGIRQTYAARITVPAPLRALMSAESLTPEGVTGPGGRTFEFRLTHPIPPYLIALAIGDLAFRPLGPRTGVYAEPSVVEGAASEFVELEQMVTAAEKLLGPYRWGRYDVLVLPPSFPFGGMENPRLTFATPTVLARDRSLVSLLAHELAHSWSGNLVTNATWRDFWLNEGVTTYVENRIMEAVYGADRAAMLRVLERRELTDEIATLGGMNDPDTILHVDLAGRDPDGGATTIAYNKGSAFLRLLEQTFGRERFDPYLRSYFDRFSFQSITTAQFLADVRQRLVAGDAARERLVGLDEWVYKPGLPANYPLAQSTVLESAGQRAREFAGGAPASSLSMKSWTTQEWQHFLNELSGPLTTTQLADLDTTFGFSASGNSEVLFLWLRLAIRHHFRPAMPALERFLTSQGRRKFVKPLFDDLMKEEWGKAEAKRIYARARPLYHAVTRTTLDPVVGLATP